MFGDVSGDHPLRAYFHTALQESLTKEMMLRDVDDVQSYLEEMLLRFLSQDALYVRDSTGRPIEVVAEMLVEGDVRLGADSFDREREVHRHIGDFLLFWSGFFPEFLSKRERLLDPVGQGSHSYYVVSTFEYGRYADEAPTFRKLSDGFREFQMALQIMRDRLGYA